MNNMYDRIVHACKERGVAPGFVCDRLGLRRALLSDLKSGKSTMLTVPKVVALAEYLHVSTDYIILGREMNENLYQDEKELIYAYRTAPVELRQNVQFILRNYMPVDEKKEGASAG